MTGRPRIPIIAGPSLCIDRFNAVPFLYWLFAGAHSIRGLIQTKSARFGYLTRGVCRAESSLTFGWQVCPTALSSQFDPLSPIRIDRRRGISVTEVEM